MAGSVDPDMLTAPFQLTASMRRDVYPAVDPKNPELNVKGKVVLITGAAGLLGHSIASAWSTAGARGVVLVGRDSKKLEATAAELTVPHLIVSGSIVSDDDVKAIFEKAQERFGTIDTVVNTAATFQFGAMIKDTAPEDWWTHYETNVKGFYNVAYHFIKLTNGTGTLINLTTLGAFLSMPGFSSYSSSKVAAVKLAEYMDLENPNLRVFSIHPGLVELEGGRGIPVESLAPFQHDKAILAGGLSLYLQKPEADFLRGGFISVNWDVTEMEAHREEIVEKKLVKMGMLNATLAPGGHKWEN